MNVTREINRLLALMIVAFALTLLSAGYWAIIGRDSLLQRDDNPRLVEDTAAIRRGSIYDRDGVLLVESVVNARGQVERQYHVKAMNSALGYFSLRYGVGGAEAAYDARLRGTRPTDWASYFSREVLHRPRQGDDIRLTLDTDIQQTLARALGDRRGAVVLLSVPEGEVLALLSQPTYDPNTLDADWERLSSAEGNPFFNRALQGQYQAGGVLQTPLMSASILTNQSFDVVTADADQPLQVDGLTLRCGVPPPQSDLTFAEAYAYACPKPFSLLTERINSAVLADIIDAFQLDTPPNLEGFIAIDATEASARAGDLSDADRLYANILGQGDLTVSPLGMAAVSAAVINRGNAPQPYALAAVHNDASWQALNRTLPTTPLMTDTTARRLRELMIQNTTMGTATTAARAGLTIGGHAALAYSGDESQAWFIGFVRHDAVNGAAIAVILEDTDDPRMAAHIGGVGLQAASNNASAD